MRIAPRPYQAIRQRTGQLRLWNLFTIMTMIGVALFWHRRFGHLFDFDECPKVASLLGMGLPMAIVLCGQWPRWREAILAIAVPIVLLIGAACTWTTLDTLLQFRTVYVQPTYYSEHGTEILWGSFVWGFGQPASLTCIAVAFEWSPSEIWRNRYPVLTAVVALLNVLAANLLAILLFTSKLSDLASFGSWLRAMAPGGE